MTRPDQSTLDKRHSSPRDRSEPPHTAESDVTGATSRAHLGGFASGDTRMPPPPPVQHQQPPKQYSSSWGETVLGPSPALSARSYASSSAGSDLDINELALDNWGRGPLPPLHSRRLQGAESSRKRRNSEEEHQRRDRESSQSAASTIVGASSASTSAGATSALTSAGASSASSVVHLPSETPIIPASLASTSGPLATQAASTSVEEEAVARRREEERLRRGAAAALWGRVDTSGLRNQVGGGLQMSKGSITSRFLDRLGKSAMASDSTPSSGDSGSKEGSTSQLSVYLNARRASDDATAPGSMADIQASPSTAVHETLETAKEGSDADEKVEEDAEDEEDEEDDIDADLTGFDAEDEDEEDMHANGVPAARGWKLDAKNAKTATFRATVLAMFSKELELETWSKGTVNPHILPLSSDRINLKRISGAFSNAVFFVSYDTNGLNEKGPRTVLLRVYGSGTEVLLSRRAELLILHTLSSLYEIGPHILGTFANGRVETYFDAEPIGKEGVRDLGDRREIMQEDGSLLVRGKEGRAQWVARRMRQLHEVPLDTMRRVLEQGDLRSYSETSSVFGRGVEDHLFARSHRPRPHRSSNITSSSRAIVESPAPIPTNEDVPPGDTSLVSAGIDGATAQRLIARDPLAHRNDSVASFDSLATSFNSADSMSVGSFSNESFTSPRVGPSSYFDQYSMSSSRGNGRRRSTFTPNFDPASASSTRRASSANRLQFRAAQPYPGMWRRSKRWAREAGKVFALVEDFCQTTAGRAAYEKALRGTPLEGVIFSPFTTELLPRMKSTEIGYTNTSLQNTLLAIAAIDFPRLLLEMDAFKRHVRKWERYNGLSRRVLAHGDTQYSNLLLIKESSLVEEGVGKGMPRARSRDRAGSIDQSGAATRTRTRKLAPYERLIVIDFEYCSPNPRAYDIANAWHEWRFDYHHPTESWSPYREPYPTRDERRRWLRAYVEQGRLLRMRGRMGKTALDSPASSATVPDQAPLEDLSLPPPIVPTSGEKVADEDKVVKRPAPVPKQQDPIAKDQLAADSANVSGASVPQLTSPAIYKACGGVEASPMLTGRSTLAQLEASMSREMDRLEREVDTFSPACHASWALWGVTFAKEALEAILMEAYDEVADAEDDLDLGLSRDVAHNLVMQATAGGEESFDNLRYALARVELFRQEIAALGISV